jgi:Zn-dependent M28 family amino/carboxypeptidase
MVGLRASATLVALSALACAPTPAARLPEPALADSAAASVRVATVQQELSILADDSMEGRGTGTIGSARAARYIADVMREIGLTPAASPGAPALAPADTGASADPDAGRARYYQRLPAVRSGRRVRILSDFGALERTPPARRAEVENVVGLLPGTDTVRGGEAIVVDAHYDHLGIGTPVNGDSIYNGADDDGSGTVAVLEIARALAARPRPRRTIVFLATTGEEVGMLGTDWYLAHPVVPLTRTMANLEIEQIGRPDQLAGGAGRAWLSGFERSTMGRSFRDAGLPVVPDPHPGEQFFQRSDNIEFAQAGVPAHTLSSFGLHVDYHEPSDEVGGIDFAHMTAVIRTAVRAVELLANGPAPRWYAGGRPTPDFH